MKKTEATDTEINRITEKAKIREKAFFTIVRQSGIRPNVIGRLKIKNVEKILDTVPPIPCKITVPKEIESGKFREHISFIGEESVTYLKNYLRAREVKDKERLAPESLLFTIHSKPTRQISVKEINRTLKRIAHEVRKGKPELDLNDLREFFKEKSEEMGHEHLAYLMGDKLDDNYVPENDEFYRRLYSDIVIDSLEIEPTRKSALRLRDKKIETLDIQLAEMQAMIEALSQMEYQMTINLLSKPPEKVRDELLLTPEAYERIRIEDEKTDKKPSERLSELNELFREFWDGKPERLNEFREKLNPKLFGKKEKTNEPS